MLSSYFEKREQIFGKREQIQGRRHPVLITMKKMVQLDLSKLLPSFLTIRSTYHSSHFSAIENKNYLIMFLSACTELPHVVTVTYITQVID